MKKMLIIILSALTVCFFISRLYYNQIYQPLLSKAGGDSQSYFFAVSH